METSERRHKTMNGVAVGDVVQVRPPEEILSGLDDRGERESMPFMPEMLKFAGRRFVVESISHKTCDTVNWTGIRKVENTVHLSGVRCDGSAHGGCQAGCLIFWKTDWLTRVSGTGEVEPDSVANAEVAAPAEGPAPTGCTAERLQEVAHGACRDDVTPSDGPVYSCQATELPRFVGAEIPRWNLRQYADDVQYGNASSRSVLWGILVGLFNLGQTASSKLLPRWLRVRAGVKYPFIVPSAERMAAANLGLEAGDWVRVRSAEEIGKTLDKNYRNRGLYFDREMLKYCGRTVQVLRRVDHIIEEPTGLMITMKTPSVILAGGICAADYHRSCPRAIYAYWRESWLERVPAPEPADRAIEPQAAQG
ncbi:hypothetical protein [Nocardioides islandensis]|nr:hypothetical protein [Nocardioides islandensis]